MASVWAFPGEDNNMGIVVLFGFSEQVYPCLSFFLDGKVGLIE